jgi:chromosome segregation ATPase
MAEKSFLTWIGFKGESNSAELQLSPRVENTPPDDNSHRQASGSTSKTTFERIKQLEAELADLRARRDITSLSKEEFEILATETATSLIKAAQARESQARRAADKALDEAQNSAKNLIESAEIKARTTLQNAEGRGRKYLEAAEHEAKEAIEKANIAVRELMESKQREANSISNAAKREAERVIAEATSEIARYKNWLGEAIAESDRLHKLQSQTLAAAEEGIKTSRARIASAFEKLSSLGNLVDNALDENHRPREKDFGDTASETKKLEASKSSVRKQVTKRAASGATKGTSKAIKRK